MKKRRRRHMAQWRKIFKPSTFDKFVRLDLKPGDVVALSAPGMISDAMAKRLKDHAETYLPGVKVLVLVDGLTISKLPHQDKAYMERALPCPDFV